MEFSETQNQIRPHIIAIGSGKGGVGKSVISASMGVGLAMLNRKVVVIDADFGGSNLHQIVGIQKPSYTYRDFQSGQYETLDAIVVEHPQFEKLGLIFGAAGSYGMANEKFFQRQRFLKQIRSVHTEFVIMDLGAGSNFQVLDLFSAADLGIVILNPDPLSLSESFNFIKQVVIRNLSQTIRKFPEIQPYIHDHAKQETFRASGMVIDLITYIENTNRQAADQMKACLNHIQMGLILNKINDDSQVTELKAMQKAIQEMLSMETELMGLIHLDDSLTQALKSGIPFMAMDPKTSASRDLANVIITRVLHRKRFHAFFDKASLRKRAHEGLPSERAVICSVNCLYWDECGYRNGGYSCKLKHMAEMGFQGEE